jgi:hypothetical protein
MGFKEYIKENKLLFGRIVDISYDKEIYSILKDNGLDSPKNKIVYVHKNAINKGDTVIYKGKVKTVSGTDIKNDNIMGITIFGDSFKLGKEPVIKLLIK